MNIQAMMKQAQALQRDMLKAKSLDEEIDFYADFTPLWDALTYTL